jgi:hypothetical protein
MAHPVTCHNTQIYVNIVKADNIIIFVLSFLIKNLVKILAKFFQNPLARILRKSCNIFRGVLSSAVRFQTIEQSSCRKNLTRFLKFLKDFCKNFAKILFKVSAGILSIFLRMVYFICLLSSILVLFTVKNKIFCISSIML